jgi:hypothetical protein
MLRQYGKKKNKLMNVDKNSSCPLAKVDVLASKQKERSAKKHNPLLDHS